MEQIDKFLEFLNYPLATISGQTVSVAQVLIVPTVILTGIFLMRWAVRVLRAKLTAQGTSADVVQLVARGFYIVAIAVLAITTLDLLNIPLTAFAFVSGAVAIGVGFGAQNIINNFISGWILMWERPIRIGDFLEVGDTRGTVEQINTRSTRIRRVDGVHLAIPNSYLLENIVVNWTMVDRLARSVVRVGVAYGSPVQKVAELIELATVEEEAVLDEPKPMVIFEDFGDSALIFDVYYWINATADRDLRVVRSNIRFRIDALFREHEITIAFPQRDVHLNGTLRLEQPSEPVFQPEQRQHTQT